MLMKTGSVVNDHRRAVGIGGRQVGRKPLLALEIGARQVPEMCRAAATTRAPQTHCHLYSCCTRTTGRDGSTHESAGADLPLRQGMWRRIFKKNGAREFDNLETDLSEATDVLAANADDAARLSALMEHYVS